MKHRRWSAALAALLLAGSIAGGSTAATASPHDRIMFTRNAALVTADQDGSDVRQVSPADNDYRSFADWSPDGKRVVYTKYVYYGSGSYDPEAWVLDVAKGEERQLTNLDDTPFAFDWSPDGKQIAYSAPIETTGIGNENLSVGINRFGLWVMDADGTNHRLIIEGSTARWSPDGSRLVFVCDFPTATKLCVVNADGTGRTEIPHTSGFQSPDWAPDGVTLVAAATAPITGYETVVLSVDGVIEHRFPGWTSARWSRDGDLAFVRYPPFQTLDVCVPDPCETYHGIWMAERDGSDVRRVTTNRYDYAPQFAR